MLSGIVSLEIKTIIGNVALLSILLVFARVAICLVQAQVMSPVLVSIFINIQNVIAPTRKILLNI